MADVRSVTIRYFHLETIQRVLLTSDMRDGWGLQYLLTCEKAVTEMGLLPRCTLRNQVRRLMENNE